MIKVTYYHRETGLFSGCQFTVTDEDAVALNTPEDHLPMLGHHDHLCKRVDVATGNVIDHKPPQPSDDHEWDETAKRWRLTAAASARKAIKAVARARIAHLEANVQPRAIREHALTRPGAAKRLQDIDDEITELRNDL